MENIKLSPIERVYQVFYDTKKQRMYFNEIREKAEMSISSLQNALMKMEKSGEIVKYKEKANTFYSLKNKEEISSNFAKFDIQRLNHLNPNVKIPIKELREKVHNIAFILLFGSASMGKEKKGSDIDLLVVTYYFENKHLNRIYQKEIRKNVEEIKKIVNAKSLYPLSIVFIDESEFKTRKDYLLEEAKTGFCIHKQQDYYLQLENEN